MYPVRTISSPFGGESMSDPSSDLGTRVSNANSFRCDASHRNSPN